MNLNYSIKIFLGLCLNSEKELIIMMRNIDHLLVLFHDRRKISQKALSALEDIDDDCDDLGVSFVEVMMHNLMFGFKAFCF